MGRQPRGQLQELVHHSAFDLLNLIGISVKSAQWLGALLFFLVLIYVDVVNASEQSIKAEAGFSVVRFHYQEFDDAGNLVDTEQGGIPGLSLNLEWKKSEWVLEGVASYQEGKVSYTGHTSFGAPYNTRTNEKIIDVALRGGKSFDARFPVMPFVGIGYHHWDRDILPGTISGLFETYHWPYFWFGAKVLVAKQKSSQHFIDIGFLKPINPQMQAIHYSPILYPESRLGFRGVYTSNFILTNKMNITLEPFYEYWDLGSSPIANSWYEPASKTNNVGINVRIGQDF